MEKVKQKKSFKATMKDTGAKAKAYAKKQTDKVKKSAKRYGTDLRTAYDIGYTQGWNAADVIPNRVGAKTAAAIGYKKGVKNCLRTNKYEKQYNRIGGKWE